MHTPAVGGLRYSDIVKVAASDQLGATGAAHRSVDHPVFRCGALLREQLRGLGQRFPAAEFQVHVIHQEENDVCGPCLRGWRRRVGWAGRLGIGAWCWRTLRVRRVAGTVRPKGPVSALDAARRHAESARSVSRVRVESPGVALGTVLRAFRATVIWPCAGKRCVVPTVRHPIARLDHEARAARVLSRRSARARDAHSRKHQHPHPRGSWMARTTTTYRADAATTCKRLGGVLALQVGSAAGGGPHSSHPFVCRPTKPDGDTWVRVQGLFSLRARLRRDALSVYQ